MTLTPATLTAVADRFAGRQGLQLHQIPAMRYTELNCLHATRLLGLEHALAGQAMAAEQKLHVE